MSNSAFLHQDFSKFSLFFRGIVDWDIWSHGALEDGTGLSPVCCVVSFRAIADNLLLLTDNRTGCYCYWRLAVMLICVRSVGDYDVCNLTGYFAFVGITVSLFFIAFVGICLLSPY